MKLFIIISVLAAASAQTIDENLLVDIFGTPPPSTEFPPPSTQRLEDITVSSTQASTILKDNNGESCTCVPYYMCDANNQLLPDSETAAESGWGVIDIRFGEDKCQESIEVCCTAPKTDVTPPTPPPEVQRKCGYNNPKGVDFTITGGNGNEALFGEYPWVVALLDAQTSQYIGVGVLIHPQVVMTAAHNVAANYKQAGKLEIRAGEWDTQTEKERLKHETRTVVDVVVHENFRPKSLWSDMALLRLNEPVPITSHIGLLCMPSQDEDFSRHKNCVANGWGKDAFGKPGRYAVILKKIVLNMVPHSVCQALFQNTRLGPRYRLSDTFVCAGGEEGKDTCQGDGGAPLACPSSDDRYRLTGLVAWGIGCGQRRVPAAYVNVAKFRRWVDDKMGKWGYTVPEE